MNKISQLEIMPEMDIKPHILKSLQSYAAHYVWIFTAIGVASVGIQFLKKDLAVFILCYNIFFMLIALTSAVTIKKINKLAYYANLIFLVNMFVSVVVSCVRFWYIFFAASDDVLYFFNGNAIFPTILILVIGVAIFSAVVVCSVFAVYYLNVLRTCKPIFFSPNRKTK